MEYVQEKADLYEIQKKVKSWERKVEIAEVTVFCLLFFFFFFFLLMNVIWESTLLQIIKFCNDREECVLHVGKCSFAQKRVSPY